jgi:hypothetical protein
MARELIGHFSADMPSRDIAKAIIAARQKREAKEAEQATPAKDEPKP